MMAPVELTPDRAREDGALGTARGPETCPSMPSGVYTSVPRLALSVEEACEALGVSWDFWQAHVVPELRIVRRGRRKLIAVAELERWLADAGERVLSPGAAGKVAPGSSDVPANRGVRASGAPVPATSRRAA
jgi:hypothetical protein